MASYKPTYRYAGSILTAPAPGVALVKEVGLVVSVPGVGPKTGGRYMGVPVKVGPIHTRLYRPHDDVEMTLPNTQLQMWIAPFESAAFREGHVGLLATQPGWSWLNWTIAEHVAYDLDVEATNRVHFHDVTTLYGGEPPLVVVPCGAAKAPCAAPAGELYRGSYHRLCLRAAKALTSPDFIRILSAKHGLLALDTVVEPYDLRLGKPGSITAEDLVAQAGQQGLLGHREVAILAGRDYTRIARAVWPQASAPLSGTRGIGEQQHRLLKIAAGAAPANV
ncbi:DUF6884 domain-containing protein [Rhodococcus sp. WY5]|uniref:DUF6884 domain-containing protein n=1 Tax=Rhodococcus sp. WY5 TaxID=2708349 RepID=UPI001BDDCAF0|nr:DUF6884 domain-containing protein [Rhodococcus sp. WY5]